MQVLYFTPLHIVSFSQARVEWKQGLFCTHCSQTVMQGFQMEQSTNDLRFLSLPAKQSSSLDQIGKT